MKRKIGKRARLLAFLLAAIVMLTSFSFSSVYAEENQASDMVQKETNIDSPGEDTTEEDKEPEKDVEKDLETERQMKQLLKEIGVGFAESDAQANTSSMPRRAKATRAAGDVINTGRIKSNSIGRIDVIDYNDPSWPQLLTWREGLLGNTDTKEPLFCADPKDHFKAGKKTGVDASTIYNKETIQTVVAMMYYYDHYMCKSINSDYEYLMKQCAVWWVLNAVHGWFADRKNILPQEITLTCGEKCEDDSEGDVNSERRCNFLCQWFCVKNDYLIKELAALKEYLNRNTNNYFKSEIQIKIKCNGKTNIDARQFEILTDYIQNKKH